MLDFVQLLSHIDAMAEARSVRRGELALALGEAQRQIDLLAGGWEKLAEKLQGHEWPWVMAIPREPLNHRQTAPQPPLKYAVVASDGSQIAPDRHEVSSCYLLNISQVRLVYGEDERPLISSQPRLYYDEKDLSVDDGGVRIPLEGKYLAIRRMLDETLQLVELIRETVRDDRPCVGLADGTLIQWPISREAQGYSRMALDMFLGALDGAQECGAPVVGYISDPGGSSVVATLRAALCPHGFLDGVRCPCVGGAANAPKAEPAPGLSTSPSDMGAAPAEVSFEAAAMTAEPAAPRSSCASLELATDSRLFRALLGPGERSAIFASTSQVLSRYGAHAVCFFYVNVGQEIARVEIPLWVAESEADVNLVHAVVMDQANKGRGYPVALSEAHERAVVQAGDRALFYQMVEKAFFKRGIPAELSLKSVSKRQPLV
ncbi:MAG TPA: DNA double-strand break repair nuclease NurA [Armatimonadota bacterium]|nr:DNA double-strand break repair nuclease NurA [Armatimonadota bacterium]